MKQITFNPNNEPYYSEDFIKGFKCGAERQFEADKKDRPQGEWIEMGQNEDGTHNVKCNQCDSAYKMRGHAKSISTKLKYRFCPHCGARMKGADNE